METYLLQLLTNGGMAGAGVVVVVLLLGLWLRHKGWLFDSPKPPPEAGRIAELKAELGEVRDRLAQVESDVRGLPTREEIAELRITQVQLAERLIALDRTAQATAHAVTRIENFMIEASQRSKK